MKWLMVTFWWSGTAEGLRDFFTFSGSDTLGDIKEAHHLGVSVIAVTWGYQFRDSLEQANPLAIVNTTKELIELIKIL